MRLCFYNLQFLKEQAAISAAEITADTVKDFVADVDEEVLEVDTSRPFSGSYASVADSDGKPFDASNGDPFLRNPYLPEAKELDPKATGNGGVNGKHHKVAEELAVKLEGNGLANLRVRYIQDEARAGIEAWQTDRIAFWHGSGGRSIQWFSCCCHDRNSTFFDQLYVCFDDEGNLFEK